MAPYDLAIGLAFSGPDGDDFPRGRAHEFKTICTGHPCQIPPRSTSSPTIASVCSRRMESAPTFVPPMTRLSMQRVERSRMRMLFSAKAPNVFVCAMTWAKLMHAPSPIVTKSGSGMGGSAPVGYKQTFCPMLAPFARKYRHKCSLPERSIKSVVSLMISHSFQRKQYELVSHG